MSNQPTQEIGKYGSLRRTFLMKNDPLTYEEMLINGTLYSHLLEMEQAVQQQIDRTMTALLAQNPAPSRNTDPMGWAQRMNSAQAQAEELALPMLYSL
ncbi:MAG: TnpV protein [Oscillospiraceae bacterium]|nr:TnpV protein [Oscillospiraceae bacterium]